MWQIILQPQILFQSTLLQEERPGAIKINGTYGVFQSTLLQEERLNQIRAASFGMYFNPRSYKRSDWGMRNQNTVGQ